MGRAERRKMMKSNKKDRRVLTIGFEKRFESITEARTELAAIWPETEQYLDTPAGGVILNYSLLGQSDAELEANMGLLTKSGRSSVTDSAGKETLLAKAFGIKGAVCLIGWGGAGFGWEPVKGGYLAFIETWPGRIFKTGEKVEQKATAMGWTRTLETPVTRGRRRMGNVDDLKAFLAQGAAKEAEKLEPLRVHAEGRSAEA